MLGNIDDVYMQSIVEPLDNGHILVPVILSFVERLSSLNGISTVEKGVLYREVNYIVSFIQRGSLSQVQL